MVIGAVRANPDDALQGDLAAPLQDKSGRVIGVIAAHLHQPREVIHPLRLTDESNPGGSAQAYVIDRAGVVLIGADGTRGKPWNGVALTGGTPALQFERLPDGRQVLVSRAPLRAAGGVPALDWRVLLCEPIGRVYQRADALARRILWVALCLGAATAVLGTIGAQQLTRRLRRLTLSVAAVGRGGGIAIDVPPGKDEVARLGRAFANILDDLQRERAELKALSDELERRVAFRTREVERLAQESRHAAVVRERLTIARDLHDTLAHSMMAMLSEIRFLRKLQSYDPAALPEELAHAEEVAHEGLKEARNAIIQMRASTVREMGLGPGLAAAFDHFIDRTGLAGDFAADPEAARFGDDRADTLLRMTHEALRNIERHARATRATMRLHMTDASHLELSVEDNGIGFDSSVSSSGHYGIVGLREQAELIGAALRIDSWPNAGTTAHGIAAAVADTVRAADSRFKERFGRSDIEYDPVPSTVRRRMNTSKRYCILVLVILLGALGGCAAYRKCGFGGCPGDKELTAAVESAFKDHAELQPPNLINIQTVDHTVYLYGLVDTDIQRLMAESLAQQVPGVTKVVNSISLQGNVL